VARKRDRILTRREFLEGSAAAALATGLGTSPLFASVLRQARTRKVIVLGFDGMDPNLCDRMMADGDLPHLAKFRDGGGYRRLGTSTPPQSPVAWANFINGAGPGTHGIFDFLHRDPKEQWRPFFSVADTVSGEGYFEMGDHKLQLDFWPFNHRAPKTVLGRQGTPFWDPLDAAGIDSQFYFLPSNYPASPSKHGHHRCFSGLGVPDLLGHQSSYQYFTQDGPVDPQFTGGGWHSMIFFENETSDPALELLGPQNPFLKKRKQASIPFVVHRDQAARAAIIEILGRRIVLKEGEWSRWVRLTYRLSTASVVPDERVSGICRFYLQEVEPNFRLYVSPINVDPSDPAIRLSEPADFVEDISDRLGLFYTAGFQEAYKAARDRVFTDAEYVRQAGMVLDERLKHLDFALKNYDDGLLFFYFSSTDMQAHMFWWDSDRPHPSRPAGDVREYFDHLKGVYRRMDAVVGDVAKRCGDQATLLVMSDHGFANFGRQFNLNTWLRDQGYLGPPDATSVETDADWSRTRAHGLGINGLYLNLMGRERDGIVRPGAEREELLTELIARLEALRDHDGRRVIHRVRRTDRAYAGPAAALAPDLVVGYRRGYRASWDTCLGHMARDVLSDNEKAWSADHCADPSQVPGVLFANRPIRADAPALVDVAPTVLAEFGLSPPSQMVGRDFLSTT